MNNIFGIIIKSNKNSNKNSKAKNLFLKNSYSYNNSFYSTKTNKKCTVLKVCNTYFPDKPCSTCTYPYPLKNDCKEINDLNDHNKKEKFKLCNPYDPNWPCNKCDKYKLAVHDLPCNVHLP